MIRWAESYGSESSVKTRTRHRRNWTGTEFLRRSSLRAAPPRVCFDPAVGGCSIGCTRWRGARLGAASPSARVAPPTSSSSSSSSRQTSHRRDDHLASRAASGRVLRLDAPIASDRVPRRPSAPALPGRPRHVLARRRFTHAQPPGARYEDPSSICSTRRAFHRPADDGRGRARRRVMLSLEREREPRATPDGPTGASPRCSWTRSPGRRSRTSPTDAGTRGHREPHRRLRVAAPDGEGSPGRAGVGEVDGRKVRIDVEVGMDRRRGRATATRLRRGGVRSDPPCSSCSRRTDAGDVSTRGTTCRRRDDVVCSYSFFISC